MRPRRVFISYAHESDEHIETVRNLWIFLRTNGIDAALDWAAADRRQDWPLWMGDQVREADHILVIASAAYRDRAEGRTGPDEGRGVQWEARLIRDAFYRDQGDLNRFVPVVLPGQSVDGVPDFLGPATMTVYKVTEFTVPGADELLRLLTKQPAETVPELGQVPVLAPRSHTLRAPDILRAALRHEVTMQVELTENGEVRTQTLLAETPLGERVASLPAGLTSCWAELDSPTGADRLAVLGQALRRTLLDEPTSQRLLDLINHSPLGSVTNLVVRLSDELAGLPVELLRLPDGQLLATTAAVRLTRRLATVDRDATTPLAGPLKILAAVAAPNETATDNAPLDVEAEMQALLDAVTHLDTASGAQVRILEVASLSEIGKALASDQYHVLHLFAHGSPDGVELEDEDGNPEFATADQLISALRAGEHPLPLVVLSSCEGASGGVDGLAATLIRHGADRVIAMQTEVTARFATNLARELYQTLAADPQTTVAQALAKARRIVTEQLLSAARKHDAPAPRPEFGVPTLLAAGGDPPLRDSVLAEAPLSRHTLALDGSGVRELPIGHLIGRRAPLRTAMSVLRRSTQDRQRFGDWAGVALTGIGGIGKTALAGRIIARAKEHGWMVAEHVGSWSPPTLIAAVADALTDPGHADLVAALHDPHREDTDKLRIVLALLARERLLVLFDDFEQNLTPNTQQFADPGFAEIFPTLCTTTKAGRVLVTSRYPIPDTETTLRRIDLPALSPAELGRLFLRLPALQSLTGEDRRLILHTIGGHPRLIEFLDVLLRHDAASMFRHVTKKLHDLAKQENVDLAPSRNLTEGVTDAVRLGSRDILLDTLLNQLTPDQVELLLQAALAQAPFTIADLAHTRHGTDTAADQLRTVRTDAERLTDLTLLSPAPNHQLIVHPWVATALHPHQTNDDLITRHQRGADMRLHRLSTGRGGFADIVELIRHLAGCRQYDEAVGVAFQACDLVGGEVAVSALLADTVPLIPTEHPRFLALADRECQALLAIGLASATAHRYQTLLEIAEQRATADQSNALYQRDLSVSHERLGDLARTVGDTTTAETHYRTSLTIRDRLAATDPGNARYQRDLSLSHERLGDLARTAGDTTTAETHYRTSLTIRDRLAATDPHNADHQRDLSLSHERLGDLARTAGDTTTAETHYRTTLTIRDRLAATDQGNTDYQRDLSVSHERLGDLARTVGDTTTAETHYRTSLTIRDRLAATDPDNADYQRDLSVSHNKLGDLARTAGDTTTAETHYRTGLTIIERLAATDPGNADYQRDLSVSHNKLGDLARTAGDTTTAETHYRTGLTIRDRLAATDPGNAGYQRDLSVSHERLGDLAHTAGDTTTAETHYRTTLTITERLAATDPGNADYQRDLSVSHNKLGDLARTAGDTTTAETHYRTTLTIIERLAAADPSNADYQRDLSISHERLGDLARIAGGRTTMSQPYEDWAAVDNWPVSIYLADGTGAAGEHISRSLHAAWQELGFELIAETEPVIGSFWQRLRAKASSPEAQQALHERIVKLERSAEVRLLAVPESLANLQNAQGLAAIIQALREESSAVIQMGPLLIVKDCNANGSSAIACRTLTPAELRMLETRPELLRDPTGILRLLTPSTPDDLDDGCTA